MADSNSENLEAEPPEPDSNEKLTILFSDIAGSTRLYDRLGDEKAYPIITSTLDIMSEIVADNHGIVVETIGDEIMCQFHDANNAIAAANHIQTTLSKNNQLSARIGLHTGIAGMHDGRPFGDIVNVAARMTGLAKAGRIIISIDTMEAFNLVNKAKLRQFEYAHVKGKEKSFQTFEYIWDEIDSTSYGQSLPILSQNIQPPRGSLICRYREIWMRIDQDHTRITIGRNEHSDMMIDDFNASRDHATIELLGDRIIYIDHSTNGSHFKVKATDGNTYEEGFDFTLHRDKWVMSGEGVIGIGEPVDQSKNLIIFELTR